MKSEVSEIDAVFTMDFKTEQLAQTIAGALEPETRSIESERANTTVSVEGSTLRIHVSAEDVTSLRAAMNSFLAWVSSSTKSMNLVLSDTSL
ncbi:MAG: KEOPS complex subunit Pcc1 [Candidatus Thorarchaeota archaeon]